MHRVRLFALLVGACLVAAGVAIAGAVRQGDPASDATAGRDALAAARAQGRPVIVFRSLATKGRVGIAGLDDPAASSLASMRCDRVHFAAATGVCVARSASFAGGYEARVFGEDLRVRHAVEVAGLPSRARVSPDGRRGAVTMFVSGHSYAEGGAFSTQTTLIDLDRGEKLGDLEDFTVSRGGRVVTAIDRNFWGVTFERDGDGFYATLATGGRSWLVHGSLRDRTMRTVHGNVECPSLSPDGTRVAYKKRIGSGDRPWRLAVLDLATRRETPLPGTHGVDDQAEWLDDHRVLYALGDEIRVVAADGSGAPRRFRRAADSPAVVRW